ncbi:MAG: O-methyltransferase [Candidatus Cohnella colombiensis]|uniref:O-methyltransferase n=1 Tax=Candidatus Cohnella colombiensis TaxID=3121368 RepID=A0AA95JBS4_9BACL|nr:MAG: O-methyltransferase [Cohnella sp.]
MNFNADQYFDLLFPEDVALAHINETIKNAGMPEISVAPGYGRLLTLLVSVSHSKRVLEIGALGGYSGVCLARGLTSEGTLTSLELREDFAHVAQSNMNACGFGGQVSYRIGDAKKSLQQLADEGERFDFFFIDADKENYPQYLEWCINLANDGALIAADNTLLRGRILDVTKQGPSVMAVRKFNETIANHPQLLGVHLPAYDGLALARVSVPGIRT